VRAERLTLAEADSRPSVFVISRSSAVKGALGAIGNKISILSIAVEDLLPGPVHSNLQEWSQTMLSAGSSGDLSKVDLGTARLSTRPDEQKTMVRRSIVSLFTHCTPYFQRPSSRAFLQRAGEEKASARVRKQRQAGERSA